MLQHKNNIYCIVMIIIIILFILFIYFNNKISLEKFEANIYDNIPNKECCIIKKEFNSDFGYSYTKVKNDMCNTQQDSNTRVMINGVDGWNNKFCNLNNPIIGSCHNSYSNHECVDFRTKQDCEKYNLRWDRKTCHNTNVPPIIDLNDRTIFKTKGKINLANNLFPVVKTDIKPHSTEYVWLLYPHDNLT